MKQISWTIYCHTHTESSRRYIGLTKKTMMFRWNQHLQNAKAKRGKGCAHFWAAIRKYGKNAFSHEVLQVCDTLEEANTAEQYWIDLYGTRNLITGFNLAKGGEHVPHPVKNPWDRPEFRAANAGRNVAHILTPSARAKQQASMATPESKAKRSAAAKVSMASPATIAKREAMLTDDYRKRISDSLKASLSSDEARAKMSAASRCSSTPDVKEKRISALRVSMSRPETRQKLSASSKQAWSSPAYRQKLASRTVSEETRSRLSSASTGRRHSPESRARQAELARLRWKDPVVVAAHAAGLIRSRQSI